MKTDLNDRDIIQQIKSAVIYSGSRFTCGQGTCGAVGVNAIIADKLEEVVDWISLVYQITNMADSGFI